MKKAIIIMVLGLLAVGCERYIESEDLGFQFPNEPPVPTALRIVHLADGINLSWQVADTIENMYFRVYYSDTLEEAHSLWETTGNFFSVITALSPGQTYRFRIASVLPGNIEGRMSNAVSTRAGVLSAIINNGDQYTNSRNVTVQFVVPTEAALMQISDNIDFGGAFWEDFSPSGNFELSPGDGVKHIYARFRFSDGTLSDSTGNVGDSIILDTEALADSIYFIPDDIILALDSIVVFYLVAQEAGGDARISFPGISGLNLTYDENASDSAADLHIYRRSYIVPPNVEVVDGVVSGIFTDIAGNTAPGMFASSLLNISNPPTPVTLVAVTETSSAIRLNWSQAIDDDFSAYHIYRGLDSAVYNDSEPVAVITSRSTLTHNDIGLNAGTTYYYRIYVYDNTGLCAASNIASALTLMSQPTGSAGLSVQIRVPEEIQR
jgi:hypothetical protein